MMEQQHPQEFYQALVAKDSAYEGVFFAGIKTTGIFCRPTCTARKPKEENCEFFGTAQGALLAGYRPCKVCKPMLLPQVPSTEVTVLMEAVEAEPTKRWSDGDVRELGFEPSTVRRQFKKRFGVTFVAYARARRMGLALEQIRKGGKVIEAQVEVGYESGSGFRDAFTKIMGQGPKGTDAHVLKAAWLDTPLGAMLALADEKHLHLLEFTDRRGLEREIEQMRARRKVAIVPGRTAITEMIERELEAYFTGKLKVFETPVWLEGSDFQKNVLKLLQGIPYGEIRSYAQQAGFLNQPKAIRAVGRANGMNQLAIIVPCHRVIGSDGQLTGYAGGLPRKKWLLAHESGLRQG